MTILNKFLIFNKERKCGTCDGTGKVSPCDWCGGSGKTNESQGGTKAFVFIVAGTAVISLINVNENIWYLTFFIPSAILSILALKEYKEQVK